VTVVDSSGWLEYFAGGPHAAAFAPAVEDGARLVVPAICVYEVFRRVLAQRGDDAALRCAALMHHGTVVDLTAPLAVAAAKLGVVHRLPLADSIILATARERGAMLWTLDADFAGIAGVRLIGSAGGQEPPGPLRPSPDSG
jgi:predicted nucleic acid-binding protein